MNSLSDLLIDRALDTDIAGEETNKKKNSPKKEEKEDIDIAELKAAIYSMKDQLDGMMRLLDGKHAKNMQSAQPDVSIMETGERVIEGVFNGEKMVGSDGNEYPVPPNYASKSKLVEGDIMKLTITNKGSFIYKQTGPIDRKRVIGELVADPDTGQWSVLADGRAYKVLTASVTFHKGKSGDEAVILVPKDGESEWGAAENIIKK